jgi:hypothetical protein
LQRGIDLSKPNRVRKIIMLPFLVFPLLIGLCLSCTGKKITFKQKALNAPFHLPIYRLDICNKKT